MDGGQSLDADVFTRRSDVEPPSRTERLRQRFDRSLRAPLAVAWNDVRTRVGGFIIGFFLLLWLIAELSLMPAWQSLVAPLVSLAVPIPGLGNVHPFNFLVVSYPYSYEGPLLAQPFTTQFPLGTDNLGRPLGEQVVHATPFMWKMVLAGSLFSVVVGTVVGALAGYSGGMLDRVLMTITDAVLTIPALALVIVLASLFPFESPYVVGLILGIDNWPGLARTVRSQVLSIREESFTEASRVMGLSKLHILRRDVIANIMPYVSVNVATSSKRIIFESVGLYFLGILATSTFNWGVMLNDAYESGLFTDLAAVHWLYVPMIVIILFSLGFLLFAQGLDRVFNVRLRARHAETTIDDDDPSEETTDTDPTVPV
jgi:peptide/nickel transport system permease protein